MTRARRLMAMPKQARRRVRLARKPRKYVRKPRKAFNQDELLERLRELGARSWRTFESARIDGDPTVDDYRKEFGSWQNAKDAAFGKDIIKVNQLDHEYICRTIIEFNLWTFRAYKKARARDPDIIPSMHRVLDEWGCWSNVKQLAREYSVKLVVSDYIKLWRRLGKKPSLSDCRDANVRIDEALRLYKKKRKLDEAVEDMRRMER